MWLNLVFGPKKMRNVLNRMQKKISQFFSSNILIKYLEIFRENISMKNLVLLRFRSDLDLHTFQKILRKRREKSPKNFFMFFVCFRIFWNSFWSSCEHNRRIFFFKLKNIYIRGLPTLKPPGSWEVLTPHAPHQVIRPQAPNAFELNPLANWLSGITG